MARPSGVLLGVDASADLLRVRDAFSSYGPDLRKTIYDASNRQLAAGWDEELRASRGADAQQIAIIAASPQVITHELGLTVATGGEGKLGFLTRPMEFGTLSRDAFTTYDRRSGNGGTHSVRRRTARQIPSRATRGWVAYPAASRWTKRAYQMLLEIVVKVAHDAVDGGIRG